MSDHIPEPPVVSLEGHPCHFCAQGTYRQAHLQDEALSVLTCTSCSTQVPKRSPLPETAAAAVVFAIRVDARIETEERRAGELGSQIDELDAEIRHLRVRRDALEKVAEPLRRDRPNLVRRSQFLRALATVLSAPTPEPSVPII